MWSKRRPANWRSGVVFPGVQTSTWTYDKQAREYYFHRFYDFQPDLDMDNPRVREEVRRIMGFWLQLGVAGFRMDAVPFVLEKPPRGKGKPQIHFDYLRAFRELLQWRVGDAVLLGEANVLPQETQPYFGAGHGLHMMFNFWVNQHLFSHSPPVTRGPSPGRSARHGSCRRQRSGRTSYETTMSSTWVASRRRTETGLRPLRHPRSRCSSTAAASAGVPPRCSATRSDSSSPTASAHAPRDAGAAYGDEIGMGETCASRSATR